jgi:hypothetical protein
LNAMPMPRQLAQGLRARHQSGRRNQRPLAECLPRINVNDLKIPKNLYTTVTAPWISLRYPFLSGVRLNARMVEFTHGGRIQHFKLKWIKTGIGLPRFAFICQCGRPVISIYFRGGNLACRRCSNAIYASQACDKHKRPALQSHRITQFLKFKPCLWHRTRKRLQARVLTTKPMTSTTRITDKALLPQLNYQSGAALALGAETVARAFAPRSRLRAAR